MILDGVDVFVSVVQSGGFSAAARQLRMPVTTVSAKIARLEEMLGVALIRRSTRRMHVTEAGQAYFTHCLEALRALEAGEAELTAAGGAPHGRLRITAPSDLAQVILPPMVHAFAERYPMVNVELIVTNTPLDLLAERIDIALRASPMHDSSLISRKLGTANLALFASRRYLERHGAPETVADLGQHEVMVHSRFPADAMLLFAGEDSLHITPTKRITSDDMQTLRALAVEGTGIALLPDFKEQPDGLERVLPSYATRGGAAYFVYPAGKFVPPQVRAFIDLAVAMQERDEGGRTRATL